MSPSPQRPFTPKSICWPKKKLWQTARAINSQRQTGKRMEDSWLSFAVSESLLRYVVVRSPEIRPRQGLFHSWPHNSEQNINQLAQTHTHELMQAIAGISWKPFRWVSADAALRSKGCVVGHSKP